MTRLNVELTEEEMKILSRFCEQERRTKTDVIRDFVRSLSRKIKKRPSL